MADLRVEIRTNFQKVLKKDPCQFQIHAIAAGLNGDDVIVVAPTGSGKTYPLLAPILFNKAGLVIVISALNTISEQIGKILADPAFGTKITADSCHAIVMPVEMFTSEDFAFILNDRLFQGRLTDVRVDEAHVVVQWARFRKEYRNLVFVRRQLPLVHWYFTSATLTEGHIAYLKDFLLLDNRTTTVIRLSNDRPNVQCIVREMRYAANGFKDALVFLGPNPTPESHPGPTLVYCNSKADAEGLATFLQGVLNARGPGMGRKVTWFHSSNSEEHAKKIVGELLQGKYWILVCTEILGMGADVPGIMTVGQYGRPPSLEAWIQRAGRAGRGTTAPAKFILLEPKKTKKKQLAAGTIEDPVIIKDEERNSPYVRRVWRVSLTP
ncbi:hypothetical protein M408DRAFT_30653 [Serendipita vermifera MAFF 305830]|uniref:DNA 3'-5' helicase n=1 Tax=Serendipita vermifera MAFF 305830 TaxID=933852 RepID=A0A0C3A633_SERVB|nr:hypothetical protein M408DRAFT_30653 [Serendipita vermifera MAFF 305830]